MKRTFVICRTMNDFVDWRESINYSIPNRECVAVLTDVPGFWDRFEGHELNEEQVVRWADYDQGPYWHDVEDHLAFALRSNQGDDHMPNLFEVGDRVHMTMLPPGVADVTVKALGVCDDKGCGKPTIVFDDPQSGEEDEGHATDFKKV